jgi:hypothetical protein
MLYMPVRADFSINQLPGLIGKKEIMMIGVEILIVLCVFLISVLAGLLIVSACILSARLSMKKGEHQVERW